MSPRSQVVPPHESLSFRGLEIKKARREVDAFSAWKRSRYPAAMLEEIDETSNQF